LLLERVFILWLQDDVGRKLGRTVLGEMDIALVGST